MTFKEQEVLRIEEERSGFTLLETTIAMVLMMIVALGSASLFSFSVYNNSGGSDRAAAMAIAPSNGGVTPRAFHIKHS